jgi:glycosyltransferase involved in cell wall biosynthesis
MDRVSVIVTAHNVAPFVGETLDSVEETLAAFRR